MANSCSNVSLTKASPDHFCIPILVREGIFVVIWLHTVCICGDDGGPGLDVPLVSPHLSVNT